MAKLLLWICIGIGGTVGGLIPGLWGSNGLLLPILLSTFGSLASIWVWYRFFRFS